MSQNPADANHRAILRSIARRAMQEARFLVSLPAAAQAELQKLEAPAPIDAGARDLRGLLWASIDNDDSRDLDQLPVAEALPGDRVKVLVAVADVDALVRQRSAIDDAA